MTLLRFKFLVGGVYTILNTIAMAAYTGRIVDSLVASSLFALGLVIVLDRTITRVYDKYKLGRKRL